MGVHPPSPTHPFLPSLLPPLPNRARLGRERVRGADDLAPGEDNVLAFPDHGDDGSAEARREVGEGGWKGAAVGGAARWPPAPEQRHGCACIAGAGGALLRRPAAARRTEPPVGAAIGALTRRGAGRRPHRRPLARAHQSATVYRRPARQTPPTAPSSARDAPIPPLPPTSECTRPARRRTAWPTGRRSAPPRARAARFAF